VREPNQASAILLCSRRRARASRLVHGVRALLLTSGLSVAACAEPELDEKKPGTDSATDAAKQTDAGRSDGGDKAPRDSGPVTPPRDDPPDTGAPDASSTVAVAAPPSWAAPLLGHYVVRVRNYSREVSTGAGTAHEIVSSARIFYDQSSGEVQMRLQMCRDEGDALGLFKGMLAYPQWYPERHLRVRYANGEFYTESPVVETIGYDETVRADCTSGGQLVDRAEVQAWLAVSGKCECPAPGARLPTKKEDCRVTDPDRDKKPGITLLTDFGGVKASNYAVSRDNSQIEHGKIDAENRQHRGSHGVNQETYQLECPGGACQRPDLRDCPVEQNTVEFGPLDARDDEALWPCDQAQTMATAVLSPGKAVFPDAVCP
jgi:hypothetical protein